MPLLCEPPCSTRTGDVLYLQRIAALPAGPPMGSCLTQRTACSRSAVRLPARGDHCTLPTRRAVHKGRLTGGNTALLRHGGKYGRLLQSRAASKTASCKQKQKQAAHQRSHWGTDTPRQVSVQTVRQATMPARLFSPAQAADQQSRRTEVRTALWLKNRRRLSRSMGQRGSTASPQFWRRAAAW